MKLVLAGFLLLIRIIGCFTVAGLINTRKVHKDGDHSFSEVMFSLDGSMIFAGGSQIVIRSWNGEENWGCLSGTLATICTDGIRVISAIDNKLEV